MVFSGHARFVVDGDGIDAPAGTFVFVPEVTSRRAANALVDGTTVLVVGGRGGTIKPSPWEYTFAAAPAAQAGEPGRAYEIAAAGLAEYPDHPPVHYDLACYASLAGDQERALEHLGRAFEGKPETREWAEEDPDLGAIRSDPRYPG